LYIGGIYHPLRSLDDLVFIPPITNAYGSGSMCLEIKGTLKESIHRFWTSEFTNDGWASRRMGAMFFPDDWRHTSSYDLVCKGYKKWAEETQEPNSLELFLERAKKAPNVPFWQHIRNVIYIRQDGSQNRCGFRGLIRRNAEKSEVCRFLEMHNIRFQIPTPPNNPIQGL
jgi:hypothetical protein